MRRNRFWSGFAAGAAAGFGALFAFNFIGPGRKSRIIRLEKTIQIGRPVHEVFDAWSDLNRIAQFSSLVKSVQRYGDRSHWVVNVSGKSFEWDAEITQLVPNQAIAWKSVSGAQTTGRISFAPLGEQTIIHLQMNYAPPLRVLKPFAATMTGQIESHIEQALRDFKNGLETETPASGERRTVENLAQATGTYGPAALTEKQNTRYGAPTIPVEFTRPPEAKS